MEENKNVAYLLCCEIKCCILLQKRKTTRGSLTTCLVQTSEMSQAGKHRIIHSHWLKGDLCYPSSILPHSCLASRNKQKNVYLTQLLSVNLDQHLAWEPASVLLQTELSWALWEQRKHRISKDPNTYPAGIQGHRDKRVPRNSELCICNWTLQNTIPVFLFEYALKSLSPISMWTQIKKYFSVRKLRIEKTTRCADTHTCCSTLSWVKSVLQNQSTISSVNSFTGVLARHTYLTKAARSRHLL